MPVEVLMPALSPTMESGKLSRWHVSEGDEVSAGDVIAEIETDKAVMELEAMEGGRVSRLLVAEGAEDVPVNEVIALLDSPNGTAPTATAQKKLPQHQAEKGPAQVAKKIEGPVITMRAALRAALAEEMRADERVLVIGEEVGEYGGAYKVTQGLLEEFGPRRVVDTPISEHAFTGLAVGAALVGLRPVVEFMTFNFAVQALDQIINSAAKTFYMSGGLLSCPIVFRGPNGSSARAAAQHSHDFSAWYAHIPGLKVVSPFSPVDAKGLLKAAIRDPNPVIFLENEFLYGTKAPVPEGEELVPRLGRASFLERGHHCTLVSYSRGLKYALEGAARLRQEGIECDVIDLRTLRPLDMETIYNSVAHTHRLVVVEEGWSVCGVGAEICAAVVENAFDHLDAPPVRVTGKDVPMPYAANLETLALPSVEEVVVAVKAVAYRQ